MKVHEQQAQRAVGREPSIDSQSCYRCQGKPPPKSRPGLVDAQVAALCSSCLGARTHEVMTRGERLPLDQHLEVA